MKVFLIQNIEITMLSTISVITEFSVKRIENSKLNFVLGSCIRTIPPQVTQGVYKNRLPKIFGCYFLK